MVDTLGAVHSIAADTGDLGGTPVCARALFPRRTLALLTERVIRRGLVDEGAATLRLKMDPKNDNRTMDDLIAYRIKFVPHPHVGSRWCIYPSYDFTHCIVDSLENVSHSLCTLEFEVRRASYFWLLENLSLYMPVVFEYSRLNITHNVMSKRKLQARPSPPCCIQPARS